MGTLLAVIVILAVLAALYLFLIRGRTGNPGLAALQGQVYAHRGLHQKPSVPENSLAAFRRAVERGFGAELDVHLLADGGLAVIHDARLERTTGRPGMVEDLTLADLPDYRLEGTEETIPTLQQVLEVFGGKTPLIIELKAERNNCAALCETVCRVLDEYPGVFCLESFDPRGIWWLRRHRPALVRGQLADDFIREPAGLPWVLRVALTNLLQNALGRPDFVAYRYGARENLSNRLCRRLWKVAGAGWTLKSAEELAGAQAEGLLPIFEGFDPVSGRPLAEDPAEAKP